MYKLTQTKAILRLSDGATIPAEPANTDYVAFLDWKAAGNMPEPADVPDPNIAVLAEIDRIETENKAGRGVREFILEILEENAGALGVDPLENILYRKAKAVDDQIRALREKLK
ncbi:hypothetical protein SAMN06265795_12654 [Noviherbaspirillum humi]|uniref:Uncharacterized protein n=1 Tax=Noviherbaspirillum humi TaxID=1688639 RepID=A0A239LUA2_9BURK|nr:hypothetical protein [Noviherbaspirillum humi]SNT33850.1 hypothetical protein SAMN06265795_12654 [Noviherbaspirillum humi]